MAGRPETEFDVIVVGSGPGAAGFIHRLLELRPGTSVAWFEEGQRNNIQSWPDELMVRCKNGDMRQHVLSSRTYIRAFSWRCFGGGDALNSGSPNRLALRVPSVPYSPLDVCQLREQGVMPKTPLGDRFMQACQEAGYAVADSTALFHSDSIAQSGKPGRAGYGSTIWAPGSGGEGKSTRVHLADSLAGRVASLHLGTRVLRVLIDQDAEGGPCAYGVVAAAHGGPEAPYTARKVVLAAGVMGTFSLLVDSGIGPAAALEARGARAVVVNEAVGRGIGDEHAILVLLVAAEAQGTVYGREGRAVTVAELADGSAGLVLWPVGLPVIWKVFAFLPWVFRCLALVLWLVQALTMLVLSPFCYVSISLDTRPCGQLVAGKGSAVTVDDSGLEVTADMLRAYRSIRPQVARFLELNRQAATSWRCRVGRCVLFAFRPFTGIFPPEGLTEFHLPDTVRRKNLASYQHWYGGCGPDVLGEGYQVRGVCNLHVADASALARLRPGGPTATVMEEGMRAADAVFASPPLGTASEPPGSPNPDADWVSI